MEYLEIYDCKLLCQKLTRRCEKELLQITTHSGAKLRLGIITVTKDEQNVAFASKVQSLAVSLGLDVTDERVAVRNVGRKFMPLIRKWAEDDSMQGILVLYKPDTNMPTLSEVYSIIPWEKDTYGEHFHNVGHFCLESEPDSGTPQPAEASAVVEIINHYQMPVKRKSVIIVGEGGPFERILMQGLCNLGVDVSFEHPQETPAGIQSGAGHAPKTKIFPVNRRGQVVISCVNKAGYFSRSRLVRDSIVIDNGYNFFRGRIGGDVDFNSNQNWCKAITPVPGGVKSVAQVITILNFTRLLKRRYGLLDEDARKDQLHRRFKHPDKKLEANRSRI